MTATALSPEVILTSLTRIVHPEFGIDVVNLGTIYGIELDHDAVTISMAHATDAPEQRTDIERLIKDTLLRRHPDLTKVTIAISYDPPWREDFITPEGELQLRNPLPAAASDSVSADDIRDSLKFVIDPEVGVNVVDLGLIYDTALHGTAAVITMTLTTPGCPLHGSIEDAIRRVIETRHPQITEISTHLVWEPAWNTDMISPAGRKALGW